MNGGGIVFVILFVFMALVAFAQKNKGVGEWALIGFSIFMLTAITANTIIDNNDKTKLVDYFHTDKPIWCKEAYGANKLVAISYPQGYRYNKELDQFESNSTTLRRASCSIDNQIVK